MADKTRKNDKSPQWSEEPYLKSLENVTTISLCASKQGKRVSWETTFPNLLVNIKQGKDERWVYLEPFPGCQGYI